MGQIVADVPSGLSLTPRQGILKKLQAGFCELNKYVGVIKAGIF
jgi:hypothetical protein